MYALVVKFMQRGGWSRGYTYTSETPYKVGDVVVVPAGGFYGVGEVTHCIGDYPFNPKMNYSFVCGLLESLSHNPADKFVNRLDGPREKLVVETVEGKTLKIVNIEPYKITVEV